MPIVLADSAISDEISAYCSENLKSCKILSLNLFDFKGSRALTDSKALDIAYKKYPHRFYINMRAEEVWFSDHITTLIRSLQDDNSLAAYSGRLFEDMLVTCNPIPGEYYNIGGSYTCKVGDTLQFFIDHSPMKEKIRVEVDPARLRPIDADLQVPDCSKFKAHCGWEPEIPYEKTMLDLLNYWREKVAVTGVYIDR